MSVSVLPKSTQYKELGDVLFQALGSQRTQRWLAEQTFVTQEAVCFWLSGRSRPRPDKLGQLAALFDLNPRTLIALAGYDDDPKAYDKVIAAHYIWRSMRCLRAADSHLAAQECDKGG